MVPPAIPIAASTIDLAKFDIPPDGIARDELLLQYQRQMTRPTPESKVLTGELRSWSGVFARTKWFATQYTSTAALMLKGRNVRVSDAETLDAIVRASGELIDPFARYSAGWSTSLAVLRPKNLRNAVLVAIREAQRYGARLVRRDMTTVEPVQNTHERAMGFLADPAHRHQRDRQTALDAYLAKVSDIISAADTSRKRLTDAERALLVDLTNVLINELGAVPIVPLSEDKESDNLAIATEFLADVVFTALRGRSYDERHVAQAYERVLITYLNRLRRGLSLEGTEDYFLMRLTAVRIDEWRREVRRKDREARFVAADDDGVRADDRVDELTAPDEGPARRTIKTAIGYIGSDPNLRIDGRLYWEAETAIAILAGEIGESAASRRDLRAVVANRWGVQRPVHARSATSALAATDVLRLMRAAVNRAGVASL
ncbi:hypothetical protein GOEFS_093_00120 [Gordonia effusa NBRC 100432]|uniref:Uncharacterized protein n=1 Tax=Gordonia effusa NBRC 100432 TaxID=1077974 RepID=H0R3N2_9ACTN|nr:hypothetical protein GOEFS_093_00120 [Gordonia effusa NBRC 100432]